MNVGIATLHYGFNEGAILQAYGLSRLLEQELQVNRAVVIDHRYPKKEAIYGRPSSGREQELAHATNDWLPLSSERFRSEDPAKAFEYVNRRCAALVVGSDVVWTLKYKRRLRRLLGKGIMPSQPYGFYPAFPNLYWPGPEVRVPKLSYAASIGTMDWTEIPRTHRSDMQKRLSSYAAISVRDERTLAFLDWLDPQLASNAVIVPDPTLSIDLLQEARLPGLRERLAAAGVDFDRPRCGVVCDDALNMREAADQLRALGYQIVGITTKNSFSDVDLFEVGLHPLDWALIFRLMNVNVVDRMHASVFCIQNSSPFVALDSYETPDENDSKTRSLLRRFGIDEYCISKEKARPGEIVELVESVSAGGINWQEVDEEQRTCRSQASRFVHTAAREIGLARQTSVAHA